MAVIAERMIDLAKPDMKVRVLEAGSGPPVLFLHGNPDNADEWRLVMARLASRHRCIAPDFPGYGKSPQLPAAFSYSLADQIGFVEAVLRVLNIADRVVLVVHDTGGMVGTAWAAANLDRLRGIVVTNTVAFEGFRWFAIARQWGDTSTLGKLRASLGMAALGLRGGKLFRRIFSAQCPQLDAVELDRFVQSFALNRAAKRATLRQFRRIMQPDFFKGFDTMWQRIGARIPCRVVWGDKDSFISVEYANRFPTKDVTILPEVGHWVALLAPDAVASAVEALSA
jgi:pimeloyl-ACP methyl ester carboxylesterase